MLKKFKREQISLPPHFMINFNKIKHDMMLFVSADAEAANKKLCIYEVCDRNSRVARTCRLFTGNPTSMRTSIPLQPPLIWHTGGVDLKSLIKSSRGGSRVSPSERVVAFSWLDTRPLLIVDRTGLRVGTTANLYTHIIGHCIKQVMFYIVLNLIQKLKILTANFYWVF
jgi:hypothetical protein